MTEYTELKVEGCKTITFKYHNICDETAICLYYSYDNFERTSYRGRTRKIHTDRKGLYFTHSRRKVRIDSRVLVTMKFSKGI